MFIASRIKVAFVLFVAIAYVEANAVDRLNSELCNTLGNLLSRSTAIKLNKKQIIPLFDPDLFNANATDEDKEMWRNLKTLKGLCIDRCP